MTSPSRRYRKATNTVNGEPRVAPAAVATREPGWAPRTERVPIAALARGDSPRSAGEVPEHMRLLAESMDPFPPILVHRATMRVIDGMHRLHAGMLRGDETIEVEFFDGDESEAFVAGVQANITHGLPLTRPDREMAAGRLVSMYPERSDRWIAQVAGLAPSTVANLRARVTDAADAPQSRVGRDGKVRPLNSAEARRAASAVIAERPEASLREVARLTGLSPATVRDVRQRIGRGDDPVPPREREGDGDTPRLRPAPRRREHRDPRTLLRILARDPALRFNEAGRSLLHWLAGKARGPEDWQLRVDVIPAHSAYLVAELARACADEWSEFNAELEQRLNDRPELPLRRG
ncbi:ParB N-terminal domain-containing protein [Dactylosporangium sp. NPDC051541]|uniref:ParB/RepB/Spo0J family partition protein n=1 Tax=Dactylosporangium sp. NPDC051541 TaxID=3363977 RepID=UPI0037A33042